MDYLVIEGYKSAAEEFSQEANLTPPVDFESIESRMDIREALQRGDVEDAITRVNDLNPEVRVSFLLSGRLGQKIKPFHAPLSDLRVGDETCKHQNFSLQYDPTLAVLCTIELQSDNFYDRFLIRTLHCISTYSSKNLSSSFVMDASLKLLNLRKRSLLREVKRVRSFYPSWRGPWRYWRLKLRRHHHSQSRNFCHRRRE